MLGTPEAWPELSGGESAGAANDAVGDTDMTATFSQGTDEMLVNNNLGAGFAVAPDPGTPGTPPPASPPEADGRATSKEDQGDGDIIIEELTGVAQADVDKHQTLYLHYTGTPTGQLATEWNKNGAMAAFQSSNPDKPLPAHFEKLPSRVTLKLIQAPAAFARPMVHKKRFKPTFKVRVEIRYRETLNFTLTLRASPLADAGFAKPELFDSATADTAQEMDNNAVTRTLLSPAGEFIEPGEEKLLTADFDFTDLRFIKSSRMFKRWIVFHCNLGSDIIYCIYDLPSVIVSRRNDQYSKAYELLMGGPPPVKRQRPSASATPSTPVPSRIHSGVEMHVKRFNAHELIDWIDKRYNEKLPGVTRRLSLEDKALLLHKAGLESNSKEHIVIPYHSWVAFEEWYTKCLDALKAIADVWDKTNPLIICGMSMDRIQSEALLMMEGLGSFIVRLSSEPGCFAVTTRVIKGNLQTCEHLLLDRVDLQRRPLMRWIQAHEPAQVLVDINTRRKYPKDQIMHTGYFITPKPPTNKQADGYLTEHVQDVLGAIPSFPDIGTNPQGILAGLDLGGGTQGNTWNQSSPITAGNSDMGDLLDMSSPLDFSAGPGISQAPNSLELIFQQGIGSTASPQGQQWASVPSVTPNMFTDMSPLTSLNQQQSMPSTSMGLPQQWNIGGSQSNPWDSQI